MNFGLARLYLLVILSLSIVHFAFSRPSLDRDVEMLDDLINATIPYIDARQAVTSRREYNKDTSEKQKIPQDVELVPPYDSNSKRGKSTAGTLVGALVGIPIAVLEGVARFLQVFLG